jgi:hypothetical protein
MELTTERCCLASCAILGYIERDEVSNQNDFMNEHRTHLSDSTVHSENVRCLYFEPIVEKSAVVVVAFEVPPCFKLKTVNILRKRRM